MMRNERLAYSLCDGNLLGYCRNQSQIPWDDDIDIMTSVETLQYLRNFTNH